MGFYDDLKSRNLVGLLAPMLKAGILSMRASDGKFIANLSVEWNSLWVHCKSSYCTNCFLWKDVIFHGIVEKHLSQKDRFVPIGCQECFKVVVRPKTLEQLFALELIQKQINSPSKCGIEIRPSVFGNYGGYFYNRGLRQGLDCYTTVRKMINESSILGPEIEVILKRACTEMEHGVGPSDKWKIQPEQIDFEMMLNERFVNDLPVITQSDHAKDYVYQKWIERAYDIGDETVFKFTDGPLYPPYVTYQHLAENEGEK